MAKAKDNRKIIVSNAKNMVKDIDTIEKGIKLFSEACETYENSTKEKARIAYAFKGNELYTVHGVDNLSDYFKRVCEGSLCGVQYKQFNDLANMFEFVWSHTELSLYNSNTASALVTYCRKDAKKVINAHTKGKISETMTKEQIREVLKVEFGGACKTVKKAEKITANSEKDNLKQSLAIVGHFIKKNANKNGDVSKAWAEILEYCK